MTLPTNDVRGETVLAAEAMRAAHGRMTVVDGATLSVRAGELVALLGANGAGKSSLLGALAGTVQDGGAVRVGTRAVAGMPAHRRARHGMAFVPERRGNVFAAMTVEENLALGLRLGAPARRAATRERILALFPILRQRLRAPAGMLSGGEQQMLAIGMALGREPAVLLLDEPSQGLAPVIYDALDSVFRALRAQGLAMLVAEQNLPFAAQIADRYLVLSHGSLVAAGGAEGLRRHEDVLAAYLN
ncbi:MULTISPECIES: ABC transporter ATP-binding protein [Cupriavidus]